jgi:transcriptional regulator GlxA family with amidase domain
MAFDLYTVADNPAPLRATGGFTIVPTYSFAQGRAPQPNVIVMGAQGQHSAAKIAWIREMSVHADVVMSVCTGAFLLAETGLIDGRKATTHHDFYADFAKGFPEVRLVRDVRYVENPGGKFCSAGGISSGIELALRVVERYFGPATTARTAYYMEYNRSSKRPVQA